jgi:hypothetical protein
MKTLVIEPLEPLSLSTSPITGIDMLSTAHPLTIPLPTTVAGALGALLGVTLASEDPVQGIRELIEKIGSRLGCRKPVILGPLLQLSTDGSWSEPLINIGWGRFVSLRCVNSEAMFIDLDVCRDCKSLAVAFTAIAYGVSLERMATESGICGEKRARAGYLYRYPVVAYRAVCRDGEVPAKTRLLYVINCEKAESLRGVVRFGGEGRVAKVYTDSVEGVSGVESILTASPGLYIALSPVPLIPKAGNAIYLEPGSFLGLERVEEIVGILPTAPGKPPRVVVEPLGLGFYEVKRVRRPAIAALPPGTVLRIGRGLSDAVHPLLEALYSMGFASLAPLKQ